MNRMGKKEIIYANGDSPQMLEANERARATFKYFWRELWWEQHRLVPALDLACVKVAFSQFVEGSAVSPMV